jgi:predicted dehydrogenase
MSVPRVGLIGVSGYSRVHLDHLWAMHGTGEIVLCAVVVIDADRQTEICERLRAIGCDVPPTMQELLAALRELRLDLCIVPTPLHLHCSHTAALLEAGVNVLVEKPLAPTLREANIIVATARTAGRVAAVGFQYLHAPEVQALKLRLLAGDIGRIQRISVCASWPRSHAYYQRNQWAGRISLADAWVLDSPVANAMAHFFMLLLYLAGETPGAVTNVRRISAELYRAQDIESFDTAVLSMMTASDCILDFYGTHSAGGVTRPILVVEGERGRAEWVQDAHALVQGPGVEWRQDAAAEPVTRERMLRDVLARCAGEDRFVCTPELAREHVRCVQALHADARITSLPENAKSIQHVDPDTYTYITGLDQHLATAFAGRIGLRAAGAPWAVAPVEFDLEQDSQPDAGVNC